MGKAAPAAPTSRQQKYLGTSYIALPLDCSVWSSIEWPRPGVQEAGKGSCVSQARARCCREPRQGSLARRARGTGVGWAPAASALAAVVTEELCENGGP